jgi:hypothetical protein
MIATTLTNEMLYGLEELPVEHQRQILDSAEALSSRRRASSEDLLVSLGLSQEEAERLAAVLEIA